MKIEELKIVNVVYSGKVDQRFNLKNLVLEENQEFDIEYDPETFPGAIVRPKDHLKIKNILLFANGKFVLNTVDIISEREIKELLEKLMTKG